MTLDLYRIKLLERQQGTLFLNKRPDVLKALISSRPRTELKSGSVWAIDNVVEVDTQGIYFRIGKISTKRLSRLTNAGFDELEVENDPNTEVFVDLELGVVGIKRNSELASETLTVARQLPRLLERGEGFPDFAIEIEIEPISQAEEFIQAIRNAYRVRFFNFTFTKPNPDDADAKLKAFENLSADANAKKGGGYLSGPDLEKETIESLARSLAASGDSAGAEIVPNQGDSPERRRLNETGASLSLEKEDEENWIQIVMAKIRIAYANLRHGKE